MANLMSELERFEQEMKELGCEASQLLPPPPPPPRRVALRGHLPQPPPPLASGLSAKSTSTAPFLVPPPPPPHMPSVGMLVVPPRSLLRGPWVNASTSSTSPVVISAPPSLPKPPPPPITSAPQYSYSITSIKAAYVPTPPPPPPPPATISSYFPVPFHLQQQYQAPPHQYNLASQITYQGQPQIHLTTPQSTVIPTTQYLYSTLYQQSKTLQTEPTIYPVPQHQQAQQLFQRDAQTITPEALESVKAALASGEGEQKAKTKKKAIPRKAAGQTWEDPTLAEWPENDHRLFCGDLGNEVNDEVLTKAFSRFTTFNMARVVRDKRTGKTKGYGFLSFANPSDLALAFKDMNGKYVGNRPIKLRKSTWKERTDMEAFQNLRHNKRQKTSKKNILHK